MIVDEDIERVREATDVAAVVGGYVLLKKQGARLVGLCPFHAEKTPSFSVSPDKGVWYCFGCQAGGDSIQFVREVEHVDFAAAVEMLAAKAGITLRYTDDDHSERRTARAKLLEAVEAVEGWCHDALIERDDAEPVRAYLAGRGYDLDVIRRWRLGWAPPKVDVPRTVGVSEAAARQAGLLSEAGNFLFAGRLIFPITDTSRRTIAFAGRRLDNPDGTPGHGGKYVNSPESSHLYAKAKVLYGLDRAKASIVTEGRAVVCEGYTDVISLHEAGITNAVAVCGTAFTEGHAQILTRFAREVVLAFDADNAGQQAAARIHAWERQFGMVVKVLELDPGDDPDTAARRDPETVRARIGSAVTLLGFRVTAALEGLGAMAPEERVLAARAAAQMVGEHPDAAVRHQYLEMIASRTGVPTRDLRPVAAASVEEGRPDAEAPRRPVDLVGREALRALAHDPSLADTLFPTLFTDPGQATAAEAFAAHPDDQTAAVAACGDGTAASAEASRAVVSDEALDGVLAAAQLVHREVVAERTAIHRLAAAGGVDDTLELVYVGQLVAKLGLSAGAHAERAGAARELAEWLHERRTLAAAADPDPGPDLGSGASPEPVTEPDAADEFADRPEGDEFVF